MDKVKKTSQSKGAGEASAKKGSTNQIPVVSEALEDEVRRREANHLDKLYGPRGARLRAKIWKRVPLERRAKAKKIPGVGIAIYYKEKLYVSWTPYTLNPSYCGYRTYRMGHPEYWEWLQETHLVPRNIPYQWVPRARVTYEEKTEQFTLFADRCIFKNKRKIQAIKRRLNLPPSTRVVADRHYQCFRCFQKIPPKWAADREWGS